MKIEVEKMLNLFKIRKDLHKIPELGFEESKTQKYLLNILKQFKNLKIHVFDFTGILVEYSYGKGEYKLFRADMDALPIKEETGCDFQSEHDGKMHACGHDLHMTILLGLIEKVVLEKLEENILFLFQPAEEGKGGAQMIIKTGIFENYHISEAYSLHVTGNLPVGTVSSKKGIFFANSQEVDILFKGKSAHVAFPENGKDALEAGVEFYNLVSKSIKKNFSIPQTIRCFFGKISAGTARNVIASECRLEGTFRSFFDDDHEKIKEILETVAEEVSKKFQIKSEIKYLSFYRHVFNNAELFLKLKKCCKSLKYKFEKAEAVFTGEDFGFFAEKYKGLLFWLGANQGEKQDLHSSKFLPNEKAIDVGINILFNLLERGKI